MKGKPSLTGHKKKILETGSVFMRIQRFNCVCNMCDVVINEILICVRNNVILTISSILMNNLHWPTIICIFCTKTK